MIDFYDPNRAAEHLDSTYDELMNGAQLLAEAFFIEAKDEKDYKSKRQAGSRV